MTRRMKTRKMKTGRMTSFAQSRDNSSIGAYQDYCNVFHYSLYIFNYHNINYISSTSLVHKHLPRWKKTVEIGLVFYCFYCSTLEFLLLTVRNSRIVQKGELFVVFTQ